MQAIIFDTETTGLQDPEVIEAAWMAVDFGQDPQGQTVLREGEPVVRRYRPSGRISMGAMATHHIMEEDLAHEPPPTASRCRPACST